jgi:hypothetical protein
MTSADGRLLICGAFGSDLNAPGTASSPAGLAPVRADEMLRTPDEVENQVLRIVLERARTGSRPLARR